MSGPALAIYVLDNIRLMPNGCALWTGPMFPLGYGRFHFRGLPHGFAHRMIWELLRGPIPGGIQVCHRCDVRNCVNPFHLFLGTIQDNLADRDRKGRQARGETAGRHKLTEAQVREIRTIDTSPRGALKAAAAKYGVTRYCILQIRNRRSWRHVQEAA